MKLRNVTAALPETVIEWLDAKCSCQGMRRSALIRYILQSDQRSEDHTKRWIEENGIGIKMSREMLAECRRFARKDKIPEDEWIQTALAKSIEARQLAEASDERHFFTGAKVRDFLGVPVIENDHLPDQRHPVVYVPRELAKEAAEQILKGKRGEESD